MASFCGYCGTELDSSDRFCAACGKPVADRADASQATHSGAEGSSEESSPHRSRRRIGLVVLLAALGLAGGVAAVLMVTGERQADAPEAQPSSTTTSIVGSTTAPDATTTSIRSEPVQLSIVVEPATSRDFDSLGYEPLWWSPDGLWVLASAEGEVCVLSTHVPEDQCFPWAGHVDAPAWSPDSTRVAFTEDGYVFGEESDLWVLDTVAGTLTNWTDDGAPYDAEGPYLDIWPVWVGDEIAFLRASSTTQLWSVARVREPIGNSEPPVSCAYPEGVVGNTGGLIDFGDSVVGVNLRQGTDSWFETCGPDGSRSELRLEEDPEIGFPSVIGRLWDDRLVLFYERAAFTSWNGSYMELSSPDGEDRTPIVAPSRGQEARAISLRSPVLLVVDSAGSAAAVVTSLGAPPGFGDVPFAGKVHTLDLRSDTAVHVIDDQPVWEASVRGLEPGRRRMQWRGGHHFLANVSYGQSAVFFAESTDDPQEGSFYRVSFAES